MNPHSERRRRLGLFGGSFDPVHAGHMHVAGSALEAFDLDRVAFVPARIPPHKPGRVLASGEDRMAMLRLATRDEERYVVCGLELERAGPSFTIDTVRALPAALGEAPDVQLFLILGSDNLEGLADWREARELIERAQPVVVDRGGEAEAARAGIARIEARLGPAAAERVRAGLLRLPPVPASSTAIRTRLATSGAREVDLSPAVLDYVRERGLYGTGG